MNMRVGVGLMMGVGVGPGVWVAPTSRLRGVGSGAVVALTVGLGTLVGTGVKVGGVGAGVFVGLKGGTAACGGAGRIGAIRASQAENSDYRYRHTHQNSYHRSRIGGYAAPSRVRPVPAAGR